VPIFVSFGHFQRSMATYVGRSDNLVGVSFSAQKEHGFGDASNPPWVEGEVCVAPVNWGSVGLRRGNFTYQVLVRAIGWVCHTYQAELGASRTCCRRSRSE
jgi:hypothetical protein